MTKETKPQPAAKSAAEKKADQAIRKVAKLEKRIDAMALELAKAVGISVEPPEES